MCAATPLPAGLALSLEARIIEAWRIKYNERRRYMVLGNIRPSEYGLQAVSSAT